MVTLRKPRRNPDTAFTLYRDGDIEHVDIWFKEKRIFTKINWSDGSTSSTFRYRIERWTSEFDNVLWTFAFDMDPELKCNWNSGFLVSNLDVKLEQEYQKYLATKELEKAIKRSK